MIASLDELARTGQLMGLITAHWRALTVAAAVRLGVFDRLGRDPRAAADLAREAGCDSAALLRLLRVLGSLGLVEEKEPGRFALGLLGEPLQSGHPASLVPAVDLVSADFHWNSWCSLAGAIRSGRAAFEERHGTTFFEYLVREPDAGRMFDAWMSRLSEIQLPAILSAYDFGWARTVVDVGGGDGTLLRGLRRAHPGLRAVLFELPAVAERAGAAAEGLEIVTGDMFQSVPGGGDLYILKTILHDWHDEACRTILRNCRAAMAAKSRMLIVEMVMPADGRPSPAYFMDLNMLVLNHGGRERTESEYRELCAGAGLRLARHIPAGGGLGLLEVLPK